MKKNSLIIGVVAVAISLLVFVVIAKAQAMGAKPQIGPDQIRVIAATGTTNLANVKLLAIDGNNFYQVVTSTPASLTLGTNGSLALNVAVNQVTVTYPTLDVPMTRQADGSYVSTSAPAGRTMRVWRNGMKAIVGTSYTVDTANLSRIVPTSAWSTDDTVTCDFFTVAP